jgi:hypothetical protein
MYEWVWSIDRMILTGKTEVLGEKKPVPVSLCPSQISHGLAQEWTQASTVRGRRPTALSHSKAFKLKSMLSILRNPIRTSQKTFIYIAKTNRVKLIRVIVLWRDYTKTRKRAMYRWSPCVACWELEVQLHTFLTSALTGHLTPGTHWSGG